MKVHYNFAGLTFFRPPETEVFINGFSEWIDHPRLPRLLKNAFSSEITTFF